MDESDFFTDLWLGWLNGFERLHCRKRRSRDGFNNRSAISRRSDFNNRRRYDFSDNGRGHFDDGRGRRLRSFNDLDLLLDVNRFRFWRRSGGSEFGGETGMGLDDFLFEIFGGDFVERAGGDLDRKSVV